MQDEEWRPLPGFPNYTISSLGRVISQVPNKKPRLLVGSTNGKWGYRILCLSRDGQRSTITLHSLVAAAFIGPRPEGMEIRHLDGDKLNNSASNLAYGTRVENERDKLRHGTHHYAKRTHCPQGHPYDAENTYLSSGGRRRHCRTCMREHSRKRKQRLRAARLAA